MRILIINGYSKDTAGQKRFSEFQYIIMKICAEQKELVDTETECYIRDKDNIDDFIYEMDSGNLRKEAAINFDQLDIVFVCGDANVRPWSQSMKKIITLIRMCIKVKKNFFACSFGMQAIIYLCASNIEKQITVLNGNGNGGKLTDKKITTKDMSQIQFTDYFLENTTGDLYGFQYETGEWVPKGNVGMHYRRSAQEFQSIGKFVLKAPTYKPNTMHEQKYKIFKQKYYEDTCVIKNMYLQDWALEGMESEFIVPLKNAWDVHTFTFINPQKVFSVLAESQLRGPIIIKSQNMLATMFAVDQKYPNTLKPIKNFILHTLKKIKSQKNYYSIPIQAALHEYKQDQVMDALKRAKQKSRNKTLDLMCQRSFKVNVQKEKKENKEEHQKDKFRHVGFSAKKEHVPDFYDQNNMRVTKIKHQATTPRSSGVSVDNSNNQNGHSRVQSLHVPGQKTLKFADNLENQPVQMAQSRQLRSVQSQRELINKNSQIKKIKINNFQDAINQNNMENSRNQLGVFDNDIISNEDLNQQGLSQGNIRRILHPELSKDFLSFKKLWVPGQLSARTQKSVSNPQMQESYMQQTYHNNHYKTSRDKQLGGVWKSQLQRGTLFQPYEKSIFTGQIQLSTSQIFREYQKQQDKKIIGPKSIKVSNGYHDKNKEISSIKHPFDNSQLNTSEVKYRIQNKNKWLAQKDFKII